MYPDLHVNYPLFLLDYDQTWIFSTDFRKIFRYENLSIGSRVVPCGRTDGETRRSYSRFFAIWRLAHRVSPHLLVRPQNSARSYSLYSDQICCAPIRVLVFSASAALLVSSPHWPTKQMRGKEKFSLVVRCILPTRTSFHAASCTGYLHY